MLLTAENILLLSSNQMQDDVPFREAQAILYNDVVSENAIRTTDALILN